MIRFMVEAGERACLRTAAWWRRGCLGSGNATEVDEERWRNIYDNEMRREIRGKENKGKEKMRRDEKVKRGKEREVKKKKRGKKILLIINLTKSFIIFLIL